MLDGPIAAKARVVPPQLTLHSNVCRLDGNPRLGGQRRVGVVGGGGVAALTATVRVNDDGLRRRRKRRRER